MMWVIITFGVLFYLYMLGKKELARQAAAKKAAEPPKVIPPEIAALIARLELSQADIARAAMADDDADESSIDYDDDADESSTDYDDDADESSTDYDDDARESSTDYDDDASESSTDYDDDPYGDKSNYDQNAPASPFLTRALAPPYVAPLPPPPVVYAMADDATSDAYNIVIRRDIERTLEKPTSLPKPVRGLEARNVQSPAVVRDSVVLQMLLKRYPGNPLFWKQRS